jgi:hypothetical protein
MCLKTYQAQDQIMAFQIHALPAGDYQKYFSMTAEELDAHNAQVHDVTAKPDAPCRVRLADADIGERVVLVNYEHQPANSPYRSAHAIFVAEGAEQAQLNVGEVPESLSMRTLSVRGFDEVDCIQDADIVVGTDLAARLDALFADDTIKYAHVHYAQRGCFAARVTRA